MKINKSKNIIKNTIIFLIAGFGLAACQSTAKVYPLKQEDVRTYSLQAVNVTIPSEANISWGLYKRNLALIEEGKPVTMVIQNVPVVEASSTSGSSSIINADNDENNIDNKPKKFKKVERTLTEAEYTKAVIIEPIQREIRSNFTQFMRGDRAVRAEVALDNLHIAKTSGKNYLAADFALYDVGTNSEIMRLDNHTVEFQPVGKRRLYSGSPVAALLATAIDAAARAAIAQASKNKRVVKMSGMYAASIRDNMAPGLKPKR